MEAHVKTSHRSQAVAPGDPGDPTEKKCKLIVTMYTELECFLRPIIMTLCMFKADFIRARSEGHLVGPRRETEDGRKRAYVHVGKAMEWI